MWWGEVAGPERHAMAMTPNSAAGEASKGIMSWGDARAVEEHRGEWE